MPDTKYFMVMWTIPETFGGMTSMCLRRSRNMLLLAGIKAPILTFDAKGRTDVLTASLLRRGHVLGGMEILNIFDFYRNKNFTAVPSGPTRMFQDVEWRGFKDIATGLTTEEVYDSSGDLYARITKNQSNVIVHRECYRKDGSVYLADVSTLGTEQEVVQRNLWLIDENQDTVAHFTSAASFYRSWLKELTGGHRTTFIFDDKVAATNLRHLELPNAVKITPIHSNHVKSAGNAMIGEIDPKRIKIVEESERWDALVFLTEEQRTDYTRRFGATSNLFVIPNPSQPTAELPAFSGRKANRGIMLGKLVPNKNAATALEIISKVRQRIPNIHLDIYGEGPQRLRLAKQIQDLGLESNVSLRGHQDAAATEYRTARFSLVTSRYEGFSLALLESMGTGCPPVTFDFKYGPKTLVQDHTNGYLIPWGETDAAADRIVDLCENDQLSQHISAAAWRRSFEFMSTPTENRAINAN